MIFKPQLLSLFLLLPTSLVYAQEAAATIDVGKESIFLVKQATNNQEQLSPNIRSIAIQRSEQYDESPMPITGNPTPSGEGQVAQSPCSSVSIDAEIEAIRKKYKLDRSGLGIFAQTMDGKTLYARNHRSYFTPASVTKLLTTAASLVLLGENYRLRTSIYGTVDGDRARLRLVGRGDPTINPEQLEDLAKQLRDKGITNIEELVAEDGYLGEIEIDPTWEVEDLQEGYGAAVNSLIVLENAIAIELIPQGLGEKLKVIWEDETEAGRWRVENKTITGSKDAEEFVRLTRDPEKRLITIYGNLRVGSASETAYVAVPDPAENFLRHFRRALKKSGIFVERASVVRRTGLEARETEPELAFIESEPLSEIIKETNKVSNNLYAEVLLRLLGIRELQRQVASGKDFSPCPSVSGSPCLSPIPAIAGLQAISDILTKLGVDPESYIQQDGSGLSRHNLISPEALVQLLRAMDRPQWQTFRDSLPVAGIGGTLRGRFRETSAEGMVLAKTGGMSGVSSLAGYITARERETLAFSIEIDSSNRPGQVRSKAIDEIVLLLQTLSPCDRE
ncbi:MAG: D-alanyl-D-alanine carboxypeptidase/D-alanyl-D-alanine-endopeptidase [Oscillatoria sp. SIO1A7]|nr:D-alanyl-D-alanine carboxypeptidase/D-alanyl-D-alanine-endopeptidase [Oscillatoria sp. SIO1A7]